MLRHIVMIRIKENLDKVDVSKEMKNKLEALEDSIESLLKIEVGINVSTKQSAFDVVLTADFVNEENLDKYRVHPEHVLVLDYLKIVMDKAVVVDYFI